ncbi:JmjC domain, hydroxylase-domain-containing protein [Macrophomina phaseolina]|uniref:JmjC domain, hydroxylase-domain-containing protein n=1 Tax=Macrophomina phaseolina TaxID=35725 RepID=A0ABQ8FXN1_9PEZI|nr:JmjC domain, hydroxylase-domain-containing protein [Macrophomina phaseolina]
MRSSLSTHSTKCYSKHAQRARSWLHDFETLHLASMALGQLSLSKNGAQCWRQAIRSAKTIIRVAENVLQLISRRPRKGNTKNKGKRDAGDVAQSELQYRSIHVSSAEGAMAWDVDKVRDLPLTIDSLAARGEIGERDFARGFLRVKVSGARAPYAQIQHTNIPADRLESSAFVLSRCRGLPQHSSPHFLQAQKVPFAHQGPRSSRKADGPFSLRLPGDHSSKSLCEWFTGLVQHYPKDELSTAPMEYLIVDVRSSADAQKLGLPGPLLSCGGRLMQTRYQIPGIHTPYAYISQSVSPFSMHIEDAGLQSANILYAGEPKLWVIIAPHHREVLEERLKSSFRATTSCAQFVRHLAPIISPQKLAEWEIDFSIVIQHPGELVVTFPFAYHFGFNLGPNRAEAINLALDRNWEPPKDYSYCSMKCSSAPITLEMLSIREEPLPNDRRTESSSEDAADPTQDSRVVTARSALTSALPAVRATQQSLPTSDGTMAFSDWPRGDAQIISQDGLMAGRSASNPGKSPRLQRHGGRSALLPLLSAYRLEKELAAASQYCPDVGGEHLRIDGPGVNEHEEESAPDVRRTRHEDGRQGEDGLLLAQLHQSQFLSTRLSPEILEAIWSSKPSDVPPWRALRAIQIAVDIANPTILGEIRIALRQPRLCVDIPQDDTEVSWGRKLAHAHVAVSNQLGFVSHAELVGGAVALAHYFMVYEAARVQLSSRIQESRREKNSARRGRKVTPITDSLSREFGHLGVGKQRDSAELLKRSIVQELIDLSFGCDRMKIRERVNVLLKQGEILCRIIGCMVAVDSSSGQPAARPLNTALLVLLPGEEKSSPELTIQGETSGTVPYTKPITLNEYRLVLPLGSAKYCQ